MSSEPSADPPSSAFAASSQAAPLRSPARPAAEFKGLSHPAMRLVLNEGDDASIDAALDDLLGDGDAFEWQPVVLDASRVADAESLGLAALCERLREARLHPVAIAGAHGALRDEADRLQLGWLAPLPERRARAAGGGGADDVASAGDSGGRRADGGGSKAAAETGGARGTSGSKGAAGSKTRAAKSASGAGASSANAETGAGDDGVTGNAPAVTPPPVPADAMVVERPVRSGQQLYARDRDLVVVGDVSPGAEVIADGHVHVYGTLGGRAIAGARGRRDAVIFTLELRAELVAVCGIYRTFEDGPPATYAGKPVRISLEADADTLSLRPL